MKMKFFSFYDIRFVIFCKVFCTHDWYAFVSGAEIFRIKKSNFVDNPEDI